MYALASKLFTQAELSTRILIFLYLKKNYLDFLILSYINFTYFLIIFETLSRCQNFHDP